MSMNLFKLCVSMRDKLFFRKFRFSPEYSLFLKTGFFADGKMIKCRVVSTIIVILSNATLLLHRRGVAKFDIYYYNNHRLYFYHF